MSELDVSNLGFSKIQDTIYASVLLGIAVAATARVLIEAANEAVSAACSWNNPEILEELLEEYGNQINLLEEEGDCFSLAIARDSKKNLNLLLNHYTKYHLCHPPETAQYKMAKFKLKKTLEDIIDGDTPQAMLEILQPYLHIAPDYDKYTALEEYKADPGFDLDLPPDSPLDSYVLNDSDHQAASHSDLLGNISPLTSI